MNNNMFCVNCSKPLADNESKYCSDCKQIITTKKKSRKSFYTGLFILLVTLGILSLMFIIPDDNPTTKPATTNPAEKEAIDQVIKSITYPDYMASPSTFLVDSENKISDFPKYFIPLNSNINDYEFTLVWVEKVINEREFIVSWVINRDNENIITFAYANYKGLEELTSDCEKTLSTYGLRGGIVHSFVYLSRYPLSPRFFPPKNENGYKKIVIGNIYHSNKGSINDYMISNGFGKATLGFKDPNSLKIQEVAELAKRGIWGDCQQYLQLLESQGD